MKKNKVKEYLEKWAIEKQGEEVPLSPEDKGLVEAVADRVCEIEYTVNQDNKIKEFIENWVAENCKEN